MNFKIAIRNLVRSPRRTLLLLATVALGVFAIFAFRGFNEGIMDDYSHKMIHGQIANGQIYKRGYRNDVFEKPSDLWIENYEAVRAALLQQEAVENVFPRIRFPSFLSNGRVNISAVGEGVSGKDEAQFFTALNFRDGAALSTQDKGIMLAEGLAKALDAKVGDTVTVLAQTIDGQLNGLDLQVVGIFWTGWKNFDDTVFRIQLTEAQALLDTNKVESLSLGLRQREAWPKVEAFVQSSYSDLEAVPFEEIDKIYYQHSVTFLNSQFQLILSIILLIVILGVFNTVSLSVLERQREIGVLRANGEGRWQILSILLTEGLLTGVVGAVLGIALAFFVNNTVLRGGILMPPAPGFSNYYYAFLKLNLMESWPWIVLGCLATVVGTLLGALGVIKRPLGEALRSI